jgi:hypothetical protein
VPGPGRYDANYEEGGSDYPIGYVRWTEQRNMAEYLRLIDQKRVSLGPLISATYPVEQAGAAYEALQAENRPMLVLLSYSDSATQAARAKVVKNPRPLPARAGAVGWG